MQIFSHNMKTLESALDMRMENQRVIAANIANMDTPGFTAQRLDFKASMDNALRGAKDAAVVNPSPAPATSLDGNNVDLDYETSQMTQNRVLFSIESQLLGAKFRQLTTMLDQER